MDDVMILYGILFMGIVVFTLALAKTNMIVELWAWIKNTPVVWMHYKSRRSKKITPAKIERGFALFRDKATKRMLAYPLNIRCLKDTGATKEAVIFEDQCLPVDFEYMRMAAQARRQGIPDYTQFEIAVAMKRLEDEIGSFDLKKPIELEDEDGNLTTYKTGLDMVKAELKERGVNPWALLDGDIREAKRREYYHLGQDGFDLFDNMKAWMQYNASPSDFEDRIQSKEIAAKEDAAFGRTLPHIDGMTLLLGLVGLGLLLFFLSRGGGLGGALGNINLTM